MGISRLWTFIKSHKDNVVTYVDLVQQAKETPGGLKILIDFYCWEHFMKDNFWKSMTEISGNTNLMFAGGEYKMMDNFVKSLVEQLRSVNIELVFYLDGAKGSAYESTRQKMRTWKSRATEEQKRLKRVFDYLRGEVPLANVDLDHLTRPCLQEVQNILTLQEAGCKIHLRVSGEADYVLAEHLRNDPQAFCVFSNDTDFCIFPDSVYLAQEFFDMENDLGLGLKSLTVKRPEKLICGVIRTDAIINILGLRNHAALVELAIMAGNDFTNPFLYPNPAFKTEYLGNFHKLSALVDAYGRAEECWFYDQAIGQNKPLREAVEHSRKFYTLTLEDEEENQRGYVFSLIVEGIQQGRLPSTIVAMHRGLYWHRQVLEDPTPGLPTAEGMLASLRAFIYAILLPNHKLTVTEIGRTPQQLMEEVQVRKVVDSRIPSLAQVKKQGFRRNRELFETIIQHQEYEMLEEGRSYFKLYGMRMGFLCYLLRYFLLMNWEQNLYLSDHEFFVLVAWTMSKHEDSVYQSWKIVPSPRCVTVENWFLSLYRAAYAFLGNILGLSHEFPAPSELFSGGTWVALYTGSHVFDPNPNFREPPPLSVCMEDLRTASLLVKRIVQDNKHVVKNVVRGLFPVE